MTGEINADRLIQSNVDTGIGKNLPYKIHDIVEIKDEKCNNKHKSHRLLIFSKIGIKNVEKWNQNWHTGPEKNKYDKFEVEIDKELKKKSSKI